MATMRRRVTLGMVGFFVLGGVSWIGAQSLALVTGEASRASGPEDVLFGAYSCRLAAGFGLEIEASFTSTGDLVSPAAAGLTDIGRFFIPTLKTTNSILDPSASFASCESIVERAERMLRSASCTLGAREVAVPSGDFLGVQYVCQGPRSALVEIIGDLGRAAMTATP